MRALILAFIVIAAACSATTAQTAAPSTSRQRPVCYIVLAFPDDAARVAFISRNTESITAQAQHLVFGSAPTRPVIHGLMYQACPSGSLDYALNLRGADAAERSREDTTVSEATAAVAQDNASLPSWNQDDPRQCVGILTTPQSTGYWQFMRRVALSGLRGVSVHGDGDHVYFSADESCALVQQVADAALPPLTVQPHYCANTSHRACGDPTTFGVGPPDPAALEQMESHHP